MPARLKGMRERTFSTRTLDCMGTCRKSAICGVSRVVSILPQNSISPEAFGSASSIRFLLPDFYS